MLSSKVLTICCCLFLITIIEVNSQSSCITPNKTLGQCGRLKSCPSLMKIVKTAILTSDDKEFLFKSKCGDQKMTTNPLVCCPKVSSPDAPVKILTNAADCGIIAEPKILGGNETSIYDYPWMALLYSSNSGESHCAGVLINDKYVLTAAHCVDDENPSTLRVVLGEHNITSKPDCDINEPTECNDETMDVEVKEITKHTKYNRQNNNKEYDIALLKLNKSIEYFTDFIKPICLPLPNEKFSDIYTIGAQHVVAGWGITENRTRSNVKLHVKLSIWDHVNCQNLYRGVGINVTENQICAGGSYNQDSCRGDSGGPLMVERGKWFLSGIVSFGTKQCGIKDWPGVYVRTERYIDWLQNNID